MEEKKLPEAKMLDMLNSSSTSVLLVEEERTDIAHFFDDPMAGIRVERNRLLSLCDWTQAADAPLDETQKQVWQAYRQELRDLTDKYTEPGQVVWPRNPSVK